MGLPAHTNAYERDRREDAVRFSEEKPADLERARAEVRAWREANPDGTQDELVEAIGSKFRKDYAVVLRAMLFRLELDQGRETAGTAADVEAAWVAGALAGSSHQSDSAAGVHGSPSGRAGDGGAVASVPPSPGRGSVAR
jgi:hypothetical protein